MPPVPSKNRPFRGFWGTIAAIAVLAIAAVIANLFEPAPANLSGRLVASDGDSFHYGQEQIRLLGIDAPELAQTCADARGADWPCGRVARDRLAALLKNAIDCDQSDRDRFGRILGRCRSAGKDIAATMVLEGLAISSEGYGPQEASARSAKRGIWVGSFQTPRAWRDDNPRN